LNYITSEWLLNGYEKLVEFSLRAVLTKTFKEIRKVDITHTRQFYVL